MKKAVAVLLITVFFFAFGQPTFAYDRHGWRGYYGSHHDYHRHRHHHHHRYHHRHRRVVVRHYGGYYPDPYYRYDVDGTALVLGTALLGTSLVNGIVGAITSPFTTPFTEGTKRLAITEEHRTKREEIRSNAVLNVPGALAGSDNAEYVSTEGSAKISASSPREPHPSCKECKEEMVKECSPDQLKQGRIERGTLGKLKNLTTGESCHYDLR